MGAHTRLIAYQCAGEFAVATYHLTAGFPREERFGLTAQLRRAAVSISANIAEGAARRGKREFRRFLDISLGSLAECECLLEIASRLGYADLNDLHALEDQRARAGRLVWGLSCSMR